MKKENVRITVKELRKIYGRHGDITEVYLTPDMITGDFSKAKQELLNHGVNSMLVGSDWAIKELEALVESKMTKNDFCDVPKTYKNKTTNDLTNEHLNLMLDVVNRGIEEDFLQVTENDKPGRITGDFYNAVDKTDDWTKDMDKFYQIYNEVKPMLDQPFLDAQIKQGMQEDCLQVSNEVIDFRMDTMAMDYSDNPQQKLRDLENFLNVMEEMIKKYEDHSLKEIRDHYRNYAMQQIGHLKRYLGNEFKPSKGGKSNMDLIDDFIGEIKDTMKDLKEDFPLPKKSSKSEFKFVGGTASGACIYTDGKEYYTDEGKSSKNLGYR